MDREELTNSTLQHSRDRALSCDLTGLPSFILQFTLGVIAFSTLLCENLVALVLVKFVINMLVIFYVHSKEM